MLYLNTDWDWEAILSCWVSKLLFPIFYIDHQSSLLNSNITKIEVLGFCVCVCFYVTYFCSFLSRMSIVFDFFLLLKTSCHIVGMINRCCQIGSRDHRCNLYALQKKKLVCFGIISVCVMSKRWFEIVFLLKCMPLSFGYHKWWLNLFSCTIFCSVLPLSSAVCFLYLETFVFWSSAHNGVYITASLQNFSLSTFFFFFFFFFFLVPSHNVSLLYVCFWL